MTVKEYFKDTCKPIFLRHFQPSEFECRCGCGLGFDDMVYSVLFKLDMARDMAEIPFIVVSAIRCPAHNKDVGGVEKSAHLTGHAIDLWVSTSRDRYVTMKYLRKAGFHRFGFYPHVPKLIHVDDDPSKVSHVFWFNKQRKRARL